MTREKLMEDLNIYFDHLENSGEVEIGNFMMFGVMEKVKDPLQAAAFLITGEDAARKERTAETVNNLLMGGGGFIGDLPTSLRALLLTAVNRYNMKLNMDQQIREDYPVHAVNSSNN